MLIMNCDRARFSRLAIVLLAGALAVSAAACSSPTPRTPGGAPDANTEGGGAPVDYGRATNPPPGPDPSLIQFTIEPPATIDPNAPYPPPAPTEAGYPGPDDATAEATAEATGDGSEG